jgi:hypothetical protein
MPPSELRRRREHPLPAARSDRTSGKPDHAGVASRLMKICDMGVALVAVPLVETGLH